MIKKNSYIRIFVFVAFLFFMGLMYISWRWAFTLNLLESPLASFLSYVLLASEFVIFLVFTNFSLILLRVDEHEEVIIDNQLQQDYYKDFFYNGKLTTFNNFCPSVDIFICTLNEDADMLAGTITACKNIDYPNKKVYVLDDGRRPEIKELTEMIGCNYITRDVNKGYKAGNVNNALSQTDSDIVVIFDSDHMPAATFLRETVYNFVDENVALVQTPQHFCNPDAFQKNLKMGKILSNEQDMFYRIIEPGLSKFDSVFCGGTNILIRRKHLESVGNFPETSITEDSLLGLMFHAQKYKVVYYNRPIAIGLAASSLDEYIKQRSRWAKGNLQILTNLKNIKYYSKLTFPQLFFFLSGALYFLTPIARIVFLMIPVIFLFFNVSSVAFVFYQIFIFQVCYFLLKMAFVFKRCIKIKNVFFADVYDLVTSIFTLTGILHTVLMPKSFKNFKFVVTQKNLNTEDVNFKYTAVLGGLFALLIAAQLQGIYDLLYSEVYSVPAIWANLFWNSVNILVLFFALQVADEKPEKRTYQRVETDESTFLEDSEKYKCEIQVEDASRSGMRFSIDKRCKENLDEKIDVDIDGENTDVELLDCDTEKEKYTCKLKFKNPINLVKFNKKKVKRLDKYVRFAYKKPDLWDTYFRKD